MCGRSHVVIGAGPVGRAVALQLASQQDALVVLIDRSRSVLAKAQGLLSDVKNIRFDVSLGPCALSIQARSLIMATSWNDCRNLVVKLAHQMHESGLHTPIICVGRPDPEDPDIARMVRNMATRSSLMWPLRIAIANLAAGRASFAPHFRNEASQAWLSRLRFQWPQPWNVSRTNSCGAPYTPANPLSPKSPRWPSRK